MVNENNVGELLYTLSALQEIDRGLPVVDQVKQVAEITRMPIVQLPKEAVAALLPMVSQLSGLPTVDVVPSVFLAPEVKWFLNDPLDVLLTEDGAVQGIHIIRARGPVDTAIVLGTNRMAGKADDDTLAKGITAVLAHELTHFLSLANEEGRVDRHFDLLTEEKMAYKVEFLNRVVHNAEEFYAQDKLIKEIVLDFANINPREL